MDWRIGIMAIFIPRDFWVLDWEKQAIVDYCKDRLEEGYRRLTCKMIDEDIAAVSPSAVYRMKSLRVK